MWQYRNKPLSWVFVSRMIGIICFLIFVVLANILTFYVSNPVFLSGVTLINENFWLLVIIAIILLVADLCGAFPFPLNLPAPIMRAFGSVFCIAVIQIIFQWVDSISGTNLYQFFWLTSFVLVPLVFLLVLASGYYDIMRRLWWQSKLEHETGSDTLVVHEEDSRKAPQPVTDVKSWEEIGSEFRLMLFDIIHRFREDIKKKN